MYSLFHALSTAIFLSAPLFNSALFLLMSPPSDGVLGYTEPQSFSPGNDNWTLNGGIILTDISLPPPVNTSFLMEYPLVNATATTSTFLAKIDYDRTMNENSQCGLYSCWDQGAAADGDLTVNKPIEPWGTEYHPETSTSNFNKQERAVDIVASNYSRQAILGSYILFAFIGFIVAWLALDGTARKSSVDCGADEKHEYRPRYWLVAWTSIFDTLRQLVDSSQLLLAPFIVYMGLQQVIGYQIIPLALSACHLDPAYPLYLVLVTAASSLLSGPLLGLLAGWLGHIKLTACWVLLQLTVMLMLLLWSHPPAWMHIIMGITWGVADSAIQLQLAVVTSCLFEDKFEAAFHQLRLWQITGHLITFVLRHIICDRAVAFLAIVLLVVATIFYLALEIRTRLLAREKKMAEKPEQSCLLPEYPAWIPNIDPHHKGQTLDLESKGLLPEDTLIST